ncbi:MAG: HAD family phosphatase [Lentisphaerae bacterium]|nr:HAD family phosphatase [Lentisphaerota bacterium]
MGFKAAIFDLDGTLLESMHIWSSLCREFLLRHGIDENIDLDGKLGVISIRSAIEYVIKEFSLDISLDDACCETWQIVEEFYREKVSLKPGVSKILETLKLRNIPAGIITATENGLVESALKRVGLQEHFEAVFSCADRQTSKRSPEIFFEMSGLLGAEPHETIVFEDALYAANTAKNAGFAVAAVYDASEKAPEKLAETADWYCRSWENFPLDIL